MENPIVISLLIFFISHPGEHLPDGINYLRLNWEALLNLAKRNKMLPFLSHLLVCRMCQENIPKRMIRKIEDSYKFYLFKRKFQEKEKRIVAKALVKNGVHVIILKDFTPYSIAYPKFVFPQQEDIDFFISGEAKEKIDQVMSSLGYEPFTPKLPPDEFARWEKDYRKTVTRIIPIIINFHFKKVIPKTTGKVNPLTQSVVESFSKIFRQSAFRQKDSLLHYPGLEENLIFLSLHFFFRDSCFGLRNLYEIGQLAKRADWKKVLTISNDLEFSSYVLFVCSTAFLLLGDKPHVSVSKQVGKDPKIRIALKLYSPSWTALASSITTKTKKLRVDLNTYFFLLTLLLWEKPLWRKIGPRTLLFILLYFIPVYIKLLKIQSIYNRLKN